MVRNEVIETTGGGDGKSRKANGNVVGVTRPDVSATLNVDEYASTDEAEARWGFPKEEGQSLSYWLQQVRCDELLDHRTTEELPKTADCVVIGSGITGTLTAKHFKEEWPQKSVIVLEARDFCSGATGRNAGHCKPDVWRGFAKYEKQFGVDDALQILQNEQDTWEALVSYVRENQVDCDLWVGDTLDVPMTTDLAAIAHENFTRFKAAGGNIAPVKVTKDPVEAARITRLKSAQACYAWQASTLQPRKLTAHIMRANLARGVNLQTFTTVRSVSPSADPQFKWIVHTDRGGIACDTVVHATNAYLAAYEPAFRGLVLPNPHMCNKVIPPLSFSGSKALQNSYGVLLPDGALYSINPRCTTDGVVMFGGTNPGQRELDSWIEDHPESCVDDGLANIKMVTDQVRTFAESEFEGWADGKALGPGQGYDYSWSGIIGRTPDGVPFVGELPGKEGQWVCAGHCGHGMARTFTAAPAIVKLIRGDSYASTGLPNAYRLTKERMERLTRSSGPVRSQVVTI